MVQIICVIILLIFWRKSSWPSESESSWDTRARGVNREDSREQSNLYGIYQACGNWSIPLICSSGDIRIRSQRKCWCQKNEGWSSLHTQRNWGMTVVTTRHRQCVQCFNNATSTDSSLQTLVRSKWTYRKTKEMWLWWLEDRFILEEWIVAVGMCMPMPERNMETMEV